MWGIDAAGWMAILLSIGWLVILEGLLSADNALVLAVMVRHLPKRQQKKALRYGIWGAFLFRLIAVIFASILLGFWWLKVLGGVYLLYLAIHHFALGEGDGAERRARDDVGFWMTVVNVEIADIAFSMDSILAAVAMAEKLPANIENALIGPFFLVGTLPLKLVIVYIGGVLGIIAMRMVAGVFLILLEKFKGLAEGAVLARRLDRRGTGGRRLDLGLAPREARRPPGSTRCRSGSVPSRRSPSGSSGRS